ncbi:MAG: hypothetical protein WC841_05835 [Candidatus Shapirobacteria bacterium]|jgi:hypothetical protein
MISHRFLAKFFFGLILAPLLFSGPKVIWAQTTATNSELNLITSPLPINLVTEPGATVSADLKIQNGGIVTEQLKVEVLKFNAYGDDGYPRLIDRQPGDSFLDWVSFSENSFELAPKQWKTITATFSIPPDAAFGYYYAITFSRAENIKADGGGQTSITGATATLILLEVRVPNAKREVEVMELSTDKKIYEFLPANFQIKLKNKGNVHLSPRGNIFIDRGNQRDVAILEINPEKGSLLPDSNRVFSTKWADGFPLYREKVKDGKVVLNKKNESEKVLEWDFSQTHKLRWGKFSAKMLIVYDNGERDIPIEGIVSFWVIPWRLVSAAGAIILLTIVGLWSTLGKILMKLINRKK